MTESNSNGKAGRTGTKGRRAAGGADPSVSHIAGRASISGSHEHHPPTGAKAAGVEFLSEHRPNAAPVRDGTGASLIQAAAHEYLWVLATLDTARRNLLMAFTGFYTHRTRSDDVANWKRAASASVATLTKSLDILDEIGRATDMYETVSRAKDHVAQLARMAQTKLRADRGLDPARPAFIDDFRELDGPATKLEECLAVLTDRVSRMADDGRAMPPEHGSR